MKPRMQPMLANATSAAGGLLARATAAAAGFRRHHLAWAGLTLAGVTFLAVNLIGATALRSWKLDLTREGLYTMSEGTRRALAAIDEPIDIRVYFSRKLGEAAPAYAKNFERVRTLIEQYRAIAGNKLNVTFLDPEPFSDAEDRAVAAGLRGIRLNPEGDLGYFGLSGSNSTDNEGTIPFFAPERERFIEYDVTKLIHSLANPNKRTVGLLTSLPIDGGLDPVMGMRGQPRPPQMVMEQLREAFEVKTLTKDLKEIPAGMDVLMLVQPDALPPEAVYAIDQFALKGGKVLLFLDPLPEMTRPPSPMMMASGGPDLGAFDKLLKAWGVAFDPGKVAGDIRHARRVQMGAGGPRGANITEYVVWLALDKRNLDQKDVLSGGIDKVNLASAGVLAQLDGSRTNVAPILLTSPDAMQIAAERVSLMPDAVGLLRAYKPEGKPLMLAARIAGEAASAFPEGRPKGEAGSAGKPDEASRVDDKGKANAKAAPTPSPDHVAQGRINAVVVADTDILADPMWVDVREFLGQQVAVPNAHNAAFVLGALENLTGSDALISLRGRGVADRPFELVNTIRRNSERAFRDKEQALTAKLKGVQEQLVKLERLGDGEAVLLSEKDRQAIERFRAEFLATRGELRSVKLALRRDIDRLDGWLQFANIALVPILIGIVGTAFAVWRRRRRAAPAAG